MIGVGQQREGQLVLVSKLLVRRLVIGRYAQNLDAALFKLGECVTEGTSFFGAPGSVVLRIKIQHHFLASKILETHLLPSASVVVNPGRTLPSLGIESSPVQLD